MKTTPLTTSANAESQPPATHKPMRAFNVYLRGKLIDTVFYSASSNEDASDVWRSLVNHDGYDSAINVRKAR